jgi:hypothetical protein
MLVFRLYDLVARVAVEREVTRAPSGDQAGIADELYPMLGNVLDELDRWLSAPEPPG